MRPETSAPAVYYHPAEVVVPGVLVDALGRWEVVLAVTVRETDVVFTLGDRHTYTVPRGRLVRVKG